MSEFSSIKASATDWWVATSDGLPHIAHVIVTFSSIAAIPPSSAGAMGAQAETSRAANAKTINALKLKRFCHCRICISFLPKNI